MMHGTTVSNPLCLTTILWYRKSMKCPRCKKTAPDKAKQCPHCRTRFVRPSDRMVRGFTIPGPVAMACGGILSFVGAVLLFYGQYYSGGLALSVGLIFLLIGKRI